MYESPRVFLSFSILSHRPLTHLLPTGGVLAAYISMGIPAKHLIAASVMSCPAALAISKLVYPERGLLFILKFLFMLVLPL